MDFSYFKYLPYINKQDKISYKNICDKFGISKEDAKNILMTLARNDYLAHSADIYYKTTFKGKHFLKSIVLEWLFRNLLSIIAIIISIIALFT